MLKQLLATQACFKQYDFLATRAYQIMKIVQDSNEDCPWLDFGLRMIKNFVRTCQNLQKLTNVLVGSLGEDFVVSIALKMTFVYALPQDRRESLIELIFASILNS